MKLLKVVSTLRLQIDLLRYLKTKWSVFPPEDKYDLENLPAYWVFRIY